MWYSSTVVEKYCRKCAKVTERSTRGRCVPCRNSYAKNYRRLNAERQSVLRAAWYRQNIEKVQAAMRSEPSRRYRKNWELRKLYGITIEDYDRILCEQGGGCAICGKAAGNRKLAVDHDHLTGEVRGILCLLCNTAIGKFGDDPERLILAALYLLRASAGSCST